MPILIEKSIFRLTLYRIWTVSILSIFLFSFLPSFPPFSFFFSLLLSFSSNKTRRFVDSSCLSSFLFLLIKFNLFIRLPLGFLSYQNFPSRYFVRNRATIDYDRYSFVRNDLKTLLSIYRSLFIPCCGHVRVRLCQATRNYRNSREERRTDHRREREGRYRSFSYFVLEIIQWVYRKECSKISHGKWTEARSKLANDSTRDGRYVERVTLLVVRVTSFFATFSLSLNDGSPCYSIARRTTQVLFQRMISAGP